MMLIEAMDAPPGEGPPGAMPGGLGNLQEDDGNFVEVNFNPDNIERAAVPVPPLVQVQDSDEEDLEDSDEEEEEDISPMPRMLRNILGRLWGRNTAAEESSSSDEEPPRDDTGVD
ncbi:hypothetical protein NLJ89_g11569 [Agrocybe chaxingu]|uniref:Uncharacterized protein n=1 Tax=Agrocybe chaxingu TaxID=84603 RepID=A0A9W8JPS2_9AGAR|nr:hypothetical protein NLJ89_g11569 [Agrocybe chaxingu]